MLNKNALISKSNQVNLCGVIGMFLSLLGLLLPGIRRAAFNDIYNYDIYKVDGVSITLFQVTMWTILPLIFILVTLALYVLSYDVLGFIAAFLSSLVYFIVILSCKAYATESLKEIPSFLVVDKSLIKIRIGIGFYLAFLGFMIAIAAPWINKLIFKDLLTSKPENQFDPNMPQGYGMDRQNPYMGQGQPQPGQFPGQNPYMGQPQPGQFANQGNPYMNQGNPYMQQGQPQGNPYMNQPNPYMNQGQANPYMAQPNPYMQQAQNQAGQAVDQFGQFVQNPEAPKTDGEQQ